MEKDYLEENGMLFNNKFVSWKELQIGMKRGDYKISFEMGKNKTGVEKLYKYIPIGNKLLSNIEETQKEYEQVTVLDFSEEKRKGRKDSIIGMTLVNIMNRYEYLLKALKGFKRKIKNLNIGELNTLYNNIDMIYKKSGLNNLKKDHISDLYITINNDMNNIIEEYIFDKNEDISSKSAINRLLETEDKEYNTMLKILKQIYTIDYFNELSNSNAFTLLSEIFSGKNEKKVIIEKIYLHIILETIKELEFAIKNILGRYDFVINIMIDNFYKDLINIYSNKNTPVFWYHKYLVINVYEYEKPNNNFYRNLRKYYKNENDNNTDFIFKVCNIFIDSLINELYLMGLAILIQTDGLDMEIPKAQIEYKRQKTDFYGTEYKKLNFKPFSYTYNISTLTELYNVTKYHLQLDNREIHKCRQCGRYFVTNTKNSEIFCRREDPKYKGNGIRYCYQVGQEHTKSKNITSIKDLHHTLYNRLRNKEPYFTDYMTKYKKWREEWRNKEITKKQFQNNLIKELDKYNKIQAKKNKTEKRNRHYLTSEDILKRHQ